MQAEIQIDGNTIKMDGQIFVNFIQDGAYVVAESAAVDVSGFGSTREEAEQKFFEALSLYLEELMNSGNLIKVLTENGWNITKDDGKNITHIVPPLVLSIEKYNIQNALNHAGTTAN